LRSFGERRVSVPGSPYTSVSTLRLTVGAIADRDPELLTLMHGSRALDLDTVLGDYVHPATQAFLVTVAIFPASPPVSLSDRRPPNPPLSLPQPFWPASLLVTPPPITHASFLILVVFEDGSTMAPVVWGSMSVRLLCQQIGTFSNVASDSVYLYFAGSILDVERSMADPAAIQAGARVYAFFSIDRALRMVLRVMQGDAGWTPTTTYESPSARTFWTATSSWFLTDSKSHAGDRFPPISDDRRGLIRFG
jgi:hypothetical protein